MKETINMFERMALKVFFISFLILLSQNTTLAQEFHGGINPPNYKGGKTALKEFIDKNLVFPDSIKNQGISGTVTINLLIDKEGKVEGLKLMRGINSFCDSEALRVSRLLSDWNPAKNWGKPVECNVLLPIEFDCGDYKNNKPVIITGTIIDKLTEQPLEGALVIVKGTNIGSVTDKNGIYKVEISDENRDIEVSFMGFEMKTEHVGKNRTINMELEKGFYTIDFNSKD